VCSSSDEMLMKHFILSAGLSTRQASIYTRGDIVHVHQKNKGPKILPWGTPDITGSTVSDKDC